MKIAYIPYEQIDRKKWDDRIRNAANSLIYARSFYLDAITDHWDALVLDDYDAVMPLVWRKKWGVRYLYQPSFIQQLGVFGNHDLKAELMETFISKAFEQFDYADITLNFANHDGFLPAGIETIEKNNYVLSLKRSYEEIYCQYLPAFTKSLRRIKKFNLEYKPSNDIAGTLELYEQLYAKRLQSVTSKDIDGFINICTNLQSTNDLVIRQVYQSGNLLAVALLLKDDQRLYNMISCITDPGKKYEANYFLYDRLIEEFSGTSLLLDLEGSDLKGVAKFYQKMHPANQPYLHVKQNNLHPVLKLLKK